MTRTVAITVNVREADADERLQRWITAVVRFADAGARDTFYYECLGKGVRGERRWQEFLLTRPDLAQGDGA
jgi:hypothetical protein